MIFEQVSLFNDSERLKLRETNDKLIRTIEDLDALRDRANVTQEELLSQQSEQLNKRFYISIFSVGNFLTIRLFNRLTRGQYWRHTGRRQHGPSPPSAAY